MSNIDKHAVQAVADLKAGYTLGHADVAILNEMARIALASIEAEPVDISDDMAYAFHHALSDSSLGADEVEEIRLGCERHSLMSPPRQRRYLCLMRWMTREVFAARFRTRMDGTPAAPPCFRVPMATLRRTSVADQRKAASLRSKAATLR
ncbi:hypothetical protein ACS3YE_001055 [Escherichia coli]